MAEVSNPQSAGLLQRVLYAAKYLYSGSAPAEWFGPLSPLPPQAPPEVKGRQFDYPVGINLNFSPRSEEPVGFAKLKALAQNCDTLRIVIEGQKDKLEALEWSIKPRVDSKGSDVDPAIAKIEALLQSPDGNLDWAQWIRALLEQLYVLDAVSIYRRRTLGGAPYSFEILDGATIKVLLDQSGRMPADPMPAYQQVLKGIVAADFTRSELLYYPQNVRADHAYGFSRVEQIILTVETAIERLKSQKGYFTHGNLSDGFFEAPLGTTPNAVQQVEERWNALTGMGVENRRMAQFLPGGFKFNEIKAPPLQEAFDEWLIRLICFTFSTSPQPFLKSHGLGNGGQETQHQAAEAAGLATIMAYVRRVMNRILRDDFGRPDLEFAWTEDREFDPKVAADIQAEKLKTGQLTINESRDADGRDPVDGGDVPLIYTSTGAVRLQDVIADKPEIEAPLPVPEGEGAPIALDPSKKKSDLAKAAAKASTEKALTKTFTTYLAAKGAEIGSQLGAALGLEKAAPADDSTGDFSGRIDHALDDIDWNWTDLKDLTEPELAGIAVAAGKDALSELGLFDKDVLAKMTERATTFAESRAAEMVGMRLVDGELVENEGWSIPAATRDMVRSAVTQAMEEGQSNQALAKTIQESEAFSPARAQTIARTETAKADVQGTIAGWKESGLVGGKQWLVADGCCDECGALDGEIVALDDDFDDGDPPLHPNCLCTIVPILTDEMAADEGDGGDE